jgi:hypothetical protein
MKNNSRSLFPSPVSLEAQKPSLGQGQFIQGFKVWALRYSRSIYLARQVLETAVAQVVEGWDKKTFSEGRNHSVTAESGGQEMICLSSIDNSV